jgi:S-DNA-T family DNA segregation ATPase FtsK/SpoIIIE
MLRPIKRRRSRRFQARPAALRTEKRRESLGAFISREALALVVLAFGLLSAASTIRPALVEGYEVTGSVTSSLHRFYTQWFGEMRVVPPLLVCIFGLRILFAPPTVRLYKRTLGVYLTAFSVSLFLHMFRLGDQEPGGWYPAGLFGKFNYDLLVPSLFDTWGASIVAFCVTVAGVSLALDIPAGKLVTGAGRLICRFLRSLAVRVKSWIHFLGRVLTGVLSLILAPARLVGRGMQRGWMRLRTAGAGSSAGPKPASERRWDDRPVVSGRTAAGDAPANRDRPVRPARGASLRDEAEKEEPQAAAAGQAVQRDTEAKDAGRRQAMAVRPSEAALFSRKELTPLPPISLLDDHRERDRAHTVDQSELLVKTLRSFDVEAQVINRMVGPVVTRYELSPAPGERVSKIVRLADDIALSLAASGIRIEAPIPGKAAIGIEVPNKEPALVRLRGIVESPEFRNSRSKLTVALGKDIAGRCIVGDLVRMVHLLVAGATGAGKSVCLNTLILSILLKATPDEVKFLMIDPKRVELSAYNGIPHLMAPVVTDPKKAAGYLLWVVEQMENRYKLFHAAGVRNIERYNELCASEDGAGMEATPLPYYVVVVDEFADMMMVAQTEVETSINRLAFMARAAGIHLVMATQRPSADIVTGIIKANIPSRIAFSVSSGIDSRIILDSVGAEKLLGRGDMLYLPNGAAKAIRVQGAYVSDEEIQRLTDYLRNLGKPEYEAKSRDLKDLKSDVSTDGDDEEDEYFREAVRLVIETGQASVSMLQRRFPIGYSRAGRLIDAMEEKGIVGPHEGSKPRKILYERGEWQKWLPADSGGVYAASASASTPESDQGDETAASAPDRDNGGS